MTGFKINRRNVIAGGTAGLTALTFGRRRALAQQNGPGVTDTEIKLGAWETMSGPVASVGVPAFRGVDSYFKMINDRGGVNGRKITFVTEDNGFNPQQTVTIARKLVELDNVLAIACPMGTVQSEAVFPYLLGEKKIPVFGPWGGVKSWFDPPREGLFGILVLNEFQCHTLGRWAAKEGAKKVIVLHSAIADWVRWAEQVDPGMKSVNPDATAERYPVKFGTADYAPIALELINKKPDAIVGILAQPEMAILAKELRQQGSNLQIYTWSTCVAQSFIELTKGTLEGGRSLSYTVPIISDTPPMREYYAALAKYYPGESPDYVSLVTFASGKLLVEALKRIQGPVNRESLVNAIQSLHEYDTGIVPPRTYSNTQHSAGTMMQRVNVVSGKWQGVGSFIDTATAW